MAWDDGYVLSHPKSSVLLQDFVRSGFSAAGVPGGVVRIVDGAGVVDTIAVGSMTALDTLFRKFIGAKTHLMPVEKDDRIVGIVTIEDLIEEILGHEIEDETDKIPAKLLRSK